jgi:hypothetical protein
MLALFWTKAPLCAGRDYSSRGNRMSENPLSKRNDTERKERLAKSALVLTAYFKRWSLVFPTHEVSKDQLKVYLMDLDDLLPTELEIGCREASRVAEQFPKPGHIRRALHESLSHREEMLGPPRLEYPPVSEEERLEALKFSDKLKRELGIKPAEPQGKKVRVFPPPKPIEQQKRELRERGYLK